MLRARDTTDKGDRGSDKHDSSVPPMIISGNAASNVACSRALGRRQHSWAGEKIHSASDRGPKMCTPRPRFIALSRRTKNTIWIQILGQLLIYGKVASTT